MADYLWRFPSPLVAARFVERPHRFAVICELEDCGTRVQAHLADPGRLRGTLTTGVRLWLSGPFPPPRKLPYSAMLAEIDGVFVNLVSALPNAWMPMILDACVVPELGLDRSAIVRSEVVLGGSRIDFELEGAEGRLMVEVKSATLHLGRGLGAFPDAPSARALRHVTELSGFVEDEMGEAAVLFVVGRGDVDRMMPAEEIDPEFAEALRMARRVGVKVLACGVLLDPFGVREVRRVETILL